MGTTLSNLLGKVWFRNRGAQAVVGDHWSEFEEDDRPVFHQLEDRILLSAGGTEQLTNLFGFESDVAVDPNNPLIVATSQFRTVAISTDGGQTFPTIVNVPPPNGYAGGGGDPTLSFDTQGNLYFGYLAINPNPVTANRNIGVFAAVIDPATGNILQNVQIAAESATDHHDKEWVAVDYWEDSPFRDNAYMVWTQLGNNPSQILFSSTTDGGVNWSAPMQLDPGGQGFVWPSEVSVGRNGDVWVGWHTNTANTAGNLGSIVLRRSSDGGATFQPQVTPFPAGTADITDNNSANNPTMPGNISWMQGAVQPRILLDPIRPNNIYVISVDDPDNNYAAGDPANIVMARSTDYGASWTRSTISHAPFGTIQTMPSASIDQDGNITVLWYDSRNGGASVGVDQVLGTADDNLLLDLYATVSLDGGLTFSNDFQVNEVPFDPDLGAGDRFPPNNVLRIGEYNGHDGDSGYAYVSWTANNGNNQDISFDVFSALSAFPDQFEENDTVDTVTVLGSASVIQHNELTIHPGDSADDEDFFLYTAHSTGKLLVHIDFINRAGDLDLEIQDSAGNQIALANSVTDDETLVIPVVGGEDYVVRVFGIGGNTNHYDLEIENFPAPVPIALSLGAGDDTGMMNNDNVTSEDEATITILTDLSDFAAMGIDILTPDEVADNEPGAAVEVFVGGQSIGFATPVLGSDNTLFTFQFGAGDLSENLNVVTAAVRIFDGQDPQEDGRGSLSQPLLLTLDTAAPATPAAPDLLASSDTGMSDDDNVTAKMQPAFAGTAEANAKVRVKANGAVVGQGVATSAGDWEVTVEPLDDGVYDITVEVEDLAGNVSEMSAATQIEIDTLQPNTPLLDLVEADDSGRHNDDNITNVNTPLLSATTHDPNAASHLLADNFKYRIYNRLEESVEVLLYDSFAETGDFTDLNQVFTTADLLNGATILGPLADGVHDLKLEVEDRAGNISEDFLLAVLIDTVAPDGTLNLHPDSDSGIWGFAETMNDLVTNDKTPMVFGVSEADALVRVDIDGVAAGTTVAVPLDGDDAFPPPPEFDGTYQLQTILNLADGEHTLEAFFRDVAGNESPASDDATITILVDTAGPRITNVTRGLVSNDNLFSFDGVTSVFEPKPSPTGPDPLIHSVVVHFSDLPDRTAAFSDVHALFEAAAGEEGNYQILGDHNGNITIVEVNVTFTTTADDGLPETAQVELVLDAPLPDDRFTIWVSDRITDPAGNPLDGESGAQAPFDGNNVPDPTAPIFPTGDGAHGGDFHARFTVDSRPEIGTFALGTSYIDINGNLVFDPEGKDRDQTNRDIVFLFGKRDDKVFAGNFAPDDALTATGYDKLGSYGVTDGKGQPAWQWRLDFDHDGVIDFEVTSGVQGEGDPVAGDFDPTHPGDEIGLFNAGRWLLDANGNNNIGDPLDLDLRGDLRGLPVVGDFDGDGLDDLGAWTPGNEGLQIKGRFSFDLAFNGLTGDAEQVIEFDLAGVFEQPVAADMNEDGIDDLGLFVTRREGVTPEESAEWFFLISDDPTPTPGQVTALDHPFTPIPFGTDFFAQFGDEQALPVVGNFDPPTTPLSPPTDSTTDSTLQAQDTSIDAATPHDGPAVAEAPVENPETTGLEPGDFASQFDPSGHTGHTLSSQPPVSSQRGSSSFAHEANDAGTRAVDVGASTTREASYVSSLSGVSLSVVPETGSLSLGTDLGSPATPSAILFAGADHHGIGMNRPHQRSATPGSSPRAGEVRTLDAGDWGQRTGVAQPGWVRGHGGQDMASASMPRTGSQEFDETTLSMASMPTIGAIAVSGIAALFTFGAESPVRRRKTGQRASTFNPVTKSQRGGVAEDHTVLMSPQPQLALGSVASSSPEDHGLQQLIDAWPDLSEVVKAGIVAMVKVSSK